MILFPVLRRVLPIPCVQRVLCPPLSPCVAVRRFPQEDADPAPCDPLEGGRDGAHGGGGRIEFLLDRVGGRVR